MFTREIVRLAYAKSAQMPQWICVKAIPDFERWINGIYVHLTFTCDEGMHCSPRDAQHGWSTEDLLWLCRYTGPAWLHWKNNELLKILFPFNFSWQFGFAFCITNPKITLTNERMCLYPSFPYTAHDFNFFKSLDSNDATRKGQKERSSTVVPWDSWITITKYRKSGQ